MGLVHLIRHGKPATTGVMLGSSDVPLLSEDIRPSLLNVDRIYASPLQRARRSAELLFPDSELVILPELMERRMGEWELKSWADIEAGWPELAERANVDWFRTTPPWGEPWNEFVARVTCGWDAILKSGSTAIVAHEGVNAVLAHLAGMGGIASFQQAYLEVISIAISD